MNHFDKMRRDFIARKRVEQGRALTAAFDRVTAECDTSGMCAIGGAVIDLRDVVLEILNLPPVGGDEESETDGQEEGSREEGDPAGQEGDAGGARSADERGDAPVPGRG